MDACEVARCAAANKLCYLCCHPSPCVSLFFENGYSCLDTRVAGVSAVSSGDLSKALICDFWIVVQMNSRGQHGVRVYQRGRGDE